MKVDYFVGQRPEPPELLALAEAVGLGESRTLERCATALELSLFVGTARVAGKLIGVVRLVGDGAYVLHVADLLVSPAAQRRGVGTQLMQLAVGFARESGVGTGDDMGELTLFSTRSGREFYGRLGFVEVRNGMCLADTEHRRSEEALLARSWDT